VNSEILKTLVLLSNQVFRVAFDIAPLNPDCIQLFVRHRLQNGLHSTDHDQRQTLREELA
jgi:hypothetical protein